MAFASFKRPISAAIFVASVALAGLVQGTAYADERESSATDTRMPGFPDVIGEYIQIPGASAPGTPAVLNTATFLRVRSARDDDEPRQADAVIIAQPGFASTAGLWLNVAAELVHNASLRRCPSGGHEDADARKHDDADAKHCRLEVWVVQRRSNNITDTLGLFEARAHNDPMAAIDYYFGRSILSLDPTRPGKFPLTPPDALLGRAGSVFRPLHQADVPFMADWGYETYAGDVAAMIALIKQEHGAKNIFLGGHSQGGLFTSTFAGWLMPDGSRGQDKLAGLIYLDGGPAPGFPAPSPAQIAAYLAGVGAFRAGAVPVFGTPFGNLILGPGTGATNGIVGAFFRKALQGESIFQPPGIGGLPFSPAGDAFLTKIRLTNQALAGMIFDPNPVPGAFLQTAIITLLGSGMGRLDFTPVPGSVSCDPKDPLHRVTPPCPADASQIDPRKVYGWLDGGGNGVPGNASKASAYGNLAGFGPSLTNVRFVTVDFPVSGRRTFYPGEMTGLFWYQSARYDADMGFLATFTSVQVHQQGVNIDVNKNLISVPIYAAKGPLTTFLGNPYPLVTDYSEINPKGVIQTGKAAAISPIDPTLNTAIYHHSDFPTADDSLVGEVKPGQPGGSIVADTLVDWLFARAKGRAQVPTPAELGVVNTR